MRAVSLENWPPGSHLGVFTCKQLGKQLGLDFKPRIVKPHHARGITVLRGFIPFVVLTVPNLVKSPSAVRGNHKNGGGQVRAL